MQCLTASTWPLLKEGESSLDSYFWLHALRPDHLPHGVLKGEPCGGRYTPWWLGHRKNTGPCVKFHWFLYKSLTVTPHAATLSSDSQHFSQSKLHNETGGKQNQLLASLDLGYLFCSKPGIWTKTKAFFILRKVLMRYLLKTSLWRKIMSLPSVDNEMML